MDYNCDVPFYVGPLFLVIGIGVLTMGALAWHLPLPPRFKSTFEHLVDTSALDSSSTHPWLWKALGPINGSVFTLVGIYMLWGTAHCPHVNLGIPDVHGPLAFTWWPGIYPAAVISTGIGIYNARMCHTNLARVLLILASFGFGLAGGEAAGFHVGIHAAQWGAITFACWLVIGATYFVDVSIQKRNNASG